jgi:indole-3-glycerol phosphate synthase
LNTYALLLEGIMTESLAVYYKASLDDAMGRMQSRPIGLLEDMIEAAPSQSTGFIEAITANPDVAVIAEHKRKSPSEGIIVSQANSVQRTAEQYIKGGATALSILTQEKHFGGSIEDVYEAAQAVEAPILRKDFISSPYQLYQAKAYGAAAALLIVDGLTNKQLRELQQEAADIKLDCLVEVHNEEDLERALSSDANLIGINNRNLSTLTTDIGTFEELYLRVPRSIPLVAESGYSVRNPDHIASLREMEADAVLMGTALMREDDPAAALASWLN